MCAGISSRARQQRQMGQRVTSESRFPEDFGLSDAKDRQKCQIKFCLLLGLISQYLFSISFTVIRVCIFTQFLLKTEGLYSQNFDTINHKLILFRTCLTKRSQLDPRDVLICINSAAADILKRSPVFEGLETT